MSPSSSLSVSKTDFNLIFDHQFHVSYLGVKKYQSNYFLFLLNAFFIFSISSFPFEKLNLTVLFLVAEDVEVRAGLLNLLLMKCLKFLFKTNPIKIATSPVNISWKRT